MAAGDVNNDGQTDLILLDLTPADVIACAALGEPTDDSGNGTPIRATCTIMYDLLTMVSRGDGFDQERVTTPWLREDFVSRVPGSLSAADLNGDARADAVFLTGAVKAERLQTLRNIRTAIRPAGGVHQFTDVTLASALTSTAGLLRDGRWQRRRAHGSDDRRAYQARRRDQLLIRFVRARRRDHGAEQQDRRLHVSGGLGRLQRVDGSDGQLGRMDAVRRSPDDAGRRHQRRRVVRLHVPRHPARAGQPAGDRPCGRFTTASRSRPPTPNGAGLPPI